MLGSRRQTPPSSIFAHTSVSKLNTRRTFEISDFTAVLTLPPAQRRMRAIFAARSRTHNSPRYRTWCSFKPSALRRGATGLPRRRDEGFGFGARSTTKIALPVSRGDFPTPVVAAQLAARRYRRHVEGCGGKKKASSRRLGLKARFDRGYVSHRNWATGQGRDFAVLFTRVKKP